MDIYEDYICYIGEHEDLILKLKNSNSNVYYILSPIVKVLDYIYTKKNDGAKIDDDLSEIFDLGYAYFSSCLEDIKAYLTEFFNNDIILFNQYASLIIALFYLDDLKAFLDSEEYLTKDRLDEIEKATNIVLENLQNKNKNILEVVEMVEAVIDECTPRRKHYEPTHYVFDLVCEELGL